MDPLELIGTIIPGIVGLTNTGVQAGMSKSDQEFSKYMSDVAWERNIEAWNMQNEYNLPANQYARQLQGLKDNGLNPNLVYGSSQSIGGAAGSVSPYKFEGYHSTSVPQLNGFNPVKDLLSTRLLQTQVQAQQASNRLTNARAANEEARNPGVIAKSEESAARWRYKLDHPEEFAEAMQGSLAVEYWRGAKTEEEAKILHEKYRLSYFDAEIADWLSSAEAPGTGMTYRQYMEACKAYIPAAQLSKFKADVLDVASRIAYRAKQGQMLDLKMEYQRAVNRLAWLGRSLGNNWVNLLLTGLMDIFGLDHNDIPGIVDSIGDTQLSMPLTYPGP